MRYSRAFVAALLAALFVACGSSSQPGPGKDVPGQDVPAVDASVADTGTPDPGEDPDLPQAVEVTYDHGVQPEAVDETIGEGTAETDVIEPGEFGWPCKQNGDCLSGFCVDTAAGKICTEVCAGECPEGWLCRNFTVGPDIYSICVPRYDRLCDPCFENKDCNADYSAGGAACVDMGKDGRFCGGDCSADSRCPTGYECKEVVDANGKKAPQCVPSDGQCECSVRATDLGLSTECRLENEFGKCTGERKCGADGLLTTCDVHEPARETCNNVDDDCNGVTDDLAEPPTCSKTTEFGTCNGTGLCVAGQVDCKAAEAKPESCNGIDDDCDGSTDNGICASTNQCTEGQCDVGAGACIYVEKTGTCDDGNACTKNDHCEAGKCVGGSTTSCDDGDPCTTDSCDSGSGECVHENYEGPSLGCEDNNACTQDACSGGKCVHVSTNDGGACEDGNLCTTGTVCAGGKCLGGTTPDCSDDNPCTKNERCEPTSGKCVWDASTGACDDDDICTDGDVCSNGVCLGKDSCKLSDCVPEAGQSSCFATQCMVVIEDFLTMCLCACE